MSSFHDWFDQRTQNPFFFFVNVMSYPLLNWWNLFIPICAMNFLLEAIVIHTRHHDISITFKFIRETPLVVEVFERGLFFLISQDSLLSFEWNQIHDSFFLVRIIVILAYRIVFLVVFLLEDRRQNSITKRMYLCFHWASHFVTMYDIQNMGFRTIVYKEITTLFLWQGRKKQLCSKLPSIYAKHALSRIFAFVICYI